MISWTEELTLREGGSDYTAVVPGGPVLTVTYDVREDDWHVVDDKGKLMMDGFPSSDRAIQWVEDQYAEQV